MPREIKSIDALKGLGINNNYSTKDRATHDYYSTPPEAIDWLLKYETFSSTVYEPMCGGGAISSKLKEYGYTVISSDIYDYGYEGTIIQDFKKCTNPFKGDIISNPPYTETTEMTLKALELTQRKVAFLMKIQFLETIKRHKLIFNKNPPSKIYVFTKRISCTKNGIEPMGAAICFCWIIWDKKWDKDTHLYWIPNYLEN